MIADLSEEDQEPYICIKEMCFTYESYSYPIESVIYFKDFGNSILV